MMNAGRLNMPLVQDEAHAASTAHYITEPLGSSVTVDDWLTLKQTGIGYHKINTHRPVHFSSFTGF